MNDKLRRRIIDLSVLTIVAVLFAFVAIYASNRKEVLVLRSIEINIDNLAQSKFITEESVKSILEDKGVVIDSILCSKIDVKALKYTLNANPYVEMVNCFVGYFNGKMFVDVQQFKPIARVIYNGENYFLNQKGRLVEQNHIAPYDVISITCEKNNLLFEDAKKSNKSSDFLEKITTFVTMVAEDEFFNMLITQINITKQGDVELFSRVGGQTIVVGHFEELNDSSPRMDKLKVFYNKGREKGLIAKYRKIDISHANQIVCVK